jgi:hypothetical protein
MVKKETIAMVIQWKRWTTTDFHLDQQSNIANIA